MTPMTKKTDIQIHHDVLEELAWDPHVDATEVGVEVDTGVVTLSGTVTTWAKRVAAQEAAHRVAGVLDVANDITVKALGGLVRTDTEIAQAVRHTLEWDVFVPDEKIASTVSTGRVTLTGTVESLSQYDAAERAVRNLAGVKAVDNLIVVKAPVPAVGSVRAAIEQALERRAEREVRQITIDVDQGVVTLRGPVRSWAERRAIVGAARATAGVRVVEDDLWPDER